MSLSPREPAEEERSPRPCSLSAQTRDYPRGEEGKCAWAIERASGRLSIMLGDVHGLHRGRGPRERLLGSTPQIDADVKTASRAVWWKKKQFNFR